MTDYRPMLAQTVNPRELAKLAEDDNIAFEQKVDGMRVIAVLGEDGVKFLNRKGETFRQFLPHDLEAKLSTLGHPWVFDGELVEDLKGGRTYWVFDVLNTPAGPAAAKDFAMRRIVLEHIFSLWSQPGVELLPSYSGRIEKLSLAKTLLANGGEGVMVKHLDAIYTPGLRNPFVRKAKFVKTVDCVVLGKQRNGKDNVVLGLYNDAGTIVDIGEVTALAGDGQTLQVGEVCEVQYLYAVDPQRPRLVQPTRPTRRTDKTADECALSQIEFTDKRILTPADLGI
jgi:ATP-dependent DNA ligase